jgi:ligand-binding sensor domain-containing protein
MSQYVREHWGAEQGLPHGAINDIAQTPDGYLWIASEQGLIRFDGVQFRLTRHQTGLGSLSGVLGLAPEPDGDLWVRLDNLTLLRYHNGTLQDPIEKGQRSTIFSIGRGTKGEMIAALGQQGIFSFSGGQLNPVLAAQGIPRTPVLAMARTGDGLYWLGTRGAGLFQLRNGSTRQLLDGLPDPKVNCLLADGPKNLWIGTDNGAVLWNGTALTPQPALSPLKNQQVLALAKDRDGNLWLGTDAGDVFRLNAGGLKALDRNKKETGFAVTAFFEDREGSIWIGSSNGLERLRDSAFVTYSGPEGVPTDGSNPVYVDRQDRMWFAAVDGGLWWWQDGQHGQVRGVGLEQEIFYSITGAPDGLAGGAGRWNHASYGRRAIVFRPNSDRQRRPCAE